MLRFFAIRSCWVLSTAILIFGQGHVGHADVIYSGKGTSAFVDALDQFSAQDGATPASVNASATINYTQFPSTPATVVVSESEFASATPGGVNLLQIGSTFSAPNAGQPVGASQPGADPYVSANWYNVAATVTGPAGSALPSSIRLEFQITYTSPSQLGQYGAPSVGITAQNLYVNGSSMTLVNAGAPLQAGMPAVVAGLNGSLTGSFSMNLPLSSSGTSNLFNLGLAYNPIGLLNHTPADVAESMTLSLKGIFLPNGAPLASEGYNVTFESGLIPPVVPTPEPTTWMLWGAVAALGMAKRLKSRRVVANQDWPSSSSFR